MYKQNMFSFWKKRIPLESEQRSSTYFKTSSYDVFFTYVFTHFLFSSSPQGALSKAFFNYNVSFLCALASFFGLLDTRALATVWFKNTREVTMFSPISSPCFHSGPGVVLARTRPSFSCLCLQQKVARWAGAGEQMGNYLPNSTCCWVLRSLNLPVQNPNSTTDQGGTCQRRILMHLPSWSAGHLVAVLLQSAPVLCSCMWARGQLHCWG